MCIHFPFLISAPTRRVNISKHFHCDNNTRSARFSFIIFSLFIVCTFYYVRTYFLLRYPITRMLFFDFGTHNSTKLIDNRKKKPTTTTVRWCRKTVPVLAQSRDSCLVYNESMFSLWHIRDSTCLIFTVFILSFLSRISAMRWGGERMDVYNIFSSILQEKHFADRIESHATGDSCVWTLHKMVFVNKNRKKKFKKIEHKN